jgi:hypothetical protein
MNEKIQFSDLSGWLKAAIITAWFMMGYAAIMFIIGFFSGVFEN